MVAAPVISSSQSAEPEITVVEASHGWRAFDFRELWRYRELVYFLAWRDVKVRYKQAALGSPGRCSSRCWPWRSSRCSSGSLANLSSEGVPYPLFAFTGLLPWLYFANATGNASGSLVGNANLISKVYFPRLIIPCPRCWPGRPGGRGWFCCCSCLSPLACCRPGLLLLPFLVLLAMVTALSVSIWLSALDVHTATCSTRCHF